MRSTFRVGSSGQQPTPMTKEILVSIFDALKIIIRLNNLQNVIYYSFNVTKLIEIVINCVSSFDRVPKTLHVIFPHVFPYHSV